MGVIRIVDGNNHFRRLLETDRTGLVHRAAIAEAAAGAALTIWCWDGRDCNRLRRSIYPRYKTGRKDPGESVWASMDLLKRVLRHTPALQVECEGFEADDVVATLARQLAASGLPVHVLSTDRDLKALEELPGVTVAANGIEGCAPSEIRLYKTLVGDSSDSVQGIPGFGAKTWEGCAKPHWLDLMEWVEVRDVAAWGRLDPDILGVPKRVMEWLEDPANQETLRSMWAVCGLLDLPAEVIRAGTVAGEPDPAKVEEILAEVML